MASMQKGFGKKKRIALWTYFTYNSAERKTQGTVVNADGQTTCGYKWSRKNTTNLKRHTMNEADFLANIGKVNVLANVTLLAVKLVWNMQQLAINIITCLTQVNFFVENIHIVISFKWNIWGKTLLAIQTFRRMCHSNKPVAGEVSLSITKHTRQRMALRPLLWEMTPTPYHIQYIWIGGGLPTSKGCGL